MDYWIKLSNEFIVSATLAAVEAYCYGDGKQKPALETFGYIWGYKKETESQIVFYVDQLALSIAARRDADSVVPNGQSAILKSNFMDTLSPHKRLLGDFHTHPYKNMNEVKKAGMGYHFSKADFISGRADDLAWKRSGNSPIMLVITICKIKRVHFSNGKAISDNIFSFNVGEFRIWITASVGYMEEGKRQFTNSDQGNRRDHRTFLDLNPIYWNETGQREQPT
jgi:hypothetical protein